MGRKHTATQLKARRERRKAIERAILKVLSDCMIATRNIEGGAQCKWLSGSDVSQIAALEAARRSM